MTKRLILHMAGPALAASMTGQALAQTTADEPQTREDAASADDIVVTALKRSDSLQKVAAAVSVIDNARLTDLGISNLVQLENLSTGVDVSPIRSRANIFIRGVGQSLASPNADSNVALNLNGVYLPGQMSGTAFFDVDRVEILPGPQGTLYGRNSTGGVLNITSRTPGDRLAADGFVEIGNYDRVQVMAGIDIPLSANLRSRTAATHNRHDGYMKNGEDDQKTTAIRQTFVWEPGASTKLTLVGSYTREGGIGNVLVNVPGLECGDRCALFDPKALGYYYRVDVFQGSLQLEQALSDTVSLTYIGGYSHLDQDSFNALFSGPPHVALLNPEKAEIQSHEIRLNIETDRLQAIVGGYYFDETGSVGVTISPVPGTLLVNPAKVASHGAAVYGQGSYSLGDTFRLTGGLRYSHNVKSIDGVNSAFNSGTGALLFSRPYEGRVSMDRVDWKAGFEWDLSPDSMAYASIATGFTPGGFSTGPEVIGQLPAKPFAPVTLTSYAGGLKNRFADGMLTLNLEGFYYDYKNYQISARDVITAQNLVYNAEKSTVYGFQLDSRLKPDRANELAVSATYLHAKADRLATPGGSFDGVDLPFSPRWTVNAYYQHAFEAGGGAEVRASANFKYTSGRWTIYTQAAPGYYQEGNTSTALNLGYHAADDRWSIQAYVRNLEDKLVKTACINAVPGPAACYFEPPRTYGLLAGFKF
ncbi:MAG TPA: TonB-dependent receptor [Sphingopyxis sp.]|nr:TonB-dependent receptor [Sphingopyxis sp.]HMP43684.1 TonB-dependent receptor [Sphingopyxis sp.]HMQ18615.1 TonB-dependent receptor [Sphingopyxis sp.]